MAPGASVMLSAMDPEVTPLERAFALAKSGKCVNVGAIKKQLAQEGYTVSQIMGQELHRQLGALCFDACRRQMPKGPKGQKRPTDVIGNAVKVMRIATGEEEEDIVDDGKDAAAVSLGKRGGKARAEALSKKERAEIAKKAAAVRWRKNPARAEEE
jgi:hypothetical protein